MTTHREVAASIAERQIKRTERFNRHVMAMVRRKPTCSHEQTVTIQVPETETASGAVIEGGSATHCANPFCNELVGVA